MSVNAFAERLSRALESTSLVQVVNAAALNDGQIRVMCRVLQGYEPAWLKLIHNILLATDAEQGQSHSWQAHICKLYLLKEVKGERKMVFGWNMSILAQNMSMALDHLDRVIRGEEPDERYTRRPGEVQEMEFTGVTGERLPNPKGKGGYTVGGKNDFRINRASTGVSK